MAGYLALGQDRHGLYGIDVKMNTRFEEQGNLMSAYDGITGMPSDNGDTLCSKLTMVDRVKRCRPVLREVIQSV